MKFARDRVKWDPSLTFVGTVLDLCGNDGLAMEHRLYLPLFGPSLALAYVIARLVQARPAAQWGTVQSEIGGWAKVITIVKGKAVDAHEPQLV